MGRMTLAIGREEVVLVGFSKTLLNPLADLLPPHSVVVVEEPSVAAKRDIAKLAAEYPSVSRIVEIEYHQTGAMADLLGREPSVASARAVLPGVEYAVAAAADLAARLGLPGAGTEAGQIFRDKARQRRAAAAAGIANPDHEVVGSAAEAAAFVARTGGRCVVKPTARQASLGVRFVSTAEEAAAAFAQAADVHEAMLEPDRGIASEVLVEQMVQGQEYSVELLVGAGRAVFGNVTAKDLIPGEYPVELGHRVPGLSPGDARGAALIDATARLAAATGFRDGALHCEWIVTGDGPVLVECAARLPGDEIGTLISAAYDFSLAHAYLRLLLGEAPKVPDAPAFGAAIRFLTAAPGVVRTVAGTEEAGRLPGVRTVRVTVRAGDEVHPVTSSWDRVGYVLAVAATAEDAELTAFAAAELIDVVTDGTGLVGPENGTVGSVSAAATSEAGSAGNPDNTTDAGAVVGTVASATPGA